MTFKNYMVRGGSRIFSRGGGLSKKFENFDDLFFFLGRPNWFFELSQSTPYFELSQSTPCFPPILAKFTAPQANFWKNSQKSRFWALLEKIWQKNRVFFGARSPSKLVYIGAKGAFRKILGSVGQKWISEKASKGGPFVSAGGRIPKGGRPHPPPPPPLNPPLNMVNLKKRSINFENIWASTLTREKQIWPWIYVYFPVIAAR